ncbi:MAG: AAA family ATPase [Bryobacteraceae bacterium]
MSSEGAPEAYTSWLRGLTPSEFDDVITLPGAMQDYVFALRKNVKDFPASVLSDGTLRFAALVAAFFQPEPPHLLTIEEIENGIHPSRLHALVELFKSQSGHPLPQTFATTHSPLVLAWLDEADYKTTFYSHKNEDTGETTITPLSEIPRFVELARNQHASELFTEGWMESAL